MQILEVSQANETEAWLEARRGKITGTKSGALNMEHYKQTDVKKLQEMRDKALESAKKAKTEEKAEEYRAKAKDYRDRITTAKVENLRYKTPVAFWQYMAEKVAVEADGEPPMERGHRLENQNADLVIANERIDPTTVLYDTGLWVSDDYPDMACSPDVHELSQAPAWAIECKSLGTAKHLSIVVPIVTHRYILKHPEDITMQMRAVEVMPSIVGDKTARDFDFLPDEYRGQALQYFVVNPDLYTLYFSFYDDRVTDSALDHVYLTIKRDTILDEIYAQRDGERHTLDIIGDITSRLIGDTE